MAGNKNRLVPYEIEKNQVHAVVEKIDWERIFLHIDVRVEGSLEGAEGKPYDFYFVDQDYFCGFKGHILSSEDGLYHLEVNITNNGCQRAILFGEYALIVVQDGRQAAKARLSYEMAGNLDAASRNFLYSNKNRVYAVSFVLDGDDENLPFYMHALPAKKVGAGTPPTNKKNKAEISLNPKTIFTNWYNKNNKINIASIYHTNRRQKSANGKKNILFYSEQSDKLGTNLAAVKNRMLARGLDSEFEIAEYTRSIKDHPTKGMKEWMDLLKKLANADIIFMDDHAPTLDWLTLDSKTKIVQLWHAGAGFKSSGYSRWGHIGCPAPWSCHRQYSYGISGSRKIAHFFSEVWGMNTSRVLPTGMPRLDEYLDKDYREAKVQELYEKYPAAKDKKVILFAPTYRGTDRSDAFYPYNMIDFEGLREVCGEEYVVFFKMHPWVSKKIPIPAEYKDVFFDLAKYPNINDLFYITELLITDYSSNIFEYSLMHKPILFFAFDEIQYSLSRGFHRPYRESAPGKVCADFSELLEAIRNQDYEYEKIEEYVANSFDYIDSGASDRVIDWFIYGQIPEDLQEEIAREDAIAEEITTLDFLPPHLKRTEEGVVNK